jgi:hypothetical protein
MTSTLVDIATLKLHPRQIREHDIGALSESLRIFGQPRPIVVQESTRYVIAGNGILKAAVALGWTQIDANIVDFDDKYALGYLVADNWLPTRSRNEDDVLYDTIKELAAFDDEILQATGVEDEDVEALERELA